MRLEYQIVSTGLDRFLRDQRTIEQELEKNSRRDTSRDNRRLQRRNRQRQTESRAIVKDASQAEARASLKAEQVAATARARQERAERSSTERQLAWRQRLQNRHFQDQERSRKRIETQGERESMRTRQRALVGFKNGLGRGIGGAASALATGARFLGGAAAIGGTFAIGNAVQTQMSETAMASTLSNQGGRDKHNKADLLREAQGIKGFTGAEALSGLGAFTDLTGDLTTARALLKDMAELSLATGSSLEDVAATAGNFANNLKGVTDPAEKAAKVMESMRALAGQGLAGAIELKDLRGGGATIGAAMAQFGGDVVGNIKKGGVLAQAARAEGGADGPEEALTALARFTDAVVAKEGKLRKLGIKAVNRGKSGQIESIADPRTLMADILDKTKGDLGMINDLFDIRGSKVVKGFTGSYRRGGRQGVLDQFDGLMNTEMSQETIRGNVDSRLGDTDIMFKEAMKEFNAELGGKLLPELTKLIPKIAELTPKIVELTDAAIKFVGWFSENPVAGVASVVGAFMVKELAVAGIGSLLSSGVSALLGSIAAKLGIAATVPVVPTALTGAPGIVAALAGSSLAMFAGGAGLAAGNLALGTQQIGQDNQARIAQDSADASQFSGANLDRYMGSRASDQGAYTSSAGLDPNLQGSPAAIQANFQPQKIETASLEAALEANTAALQASGGGGGFVMPNTRTDPILKRPLK